MLIIEGAVHNRFFTSFLLCTHVQGKSVGFLDKIFEPTTKTCSTCDHKQTLLLKDRIFDCEACDLVLDRDHNAARNILRWGISAH